MQPECSDIFTELESWYARKNGEYLLEATRETVRGLIDTSFGYHILQVGLGGERPLCEDSPINHRVFCAQRSGPGIGLVAQDDELPLASDSVDMVIAHHCLEFTANPHQVLRELQRVLTPQGQLLVLGFNPYSLQGIYARLRGLLRDPLWSRHRPVGEARLSDWLHLLGFEVLETKRLYGLPPVGRGRLRRTMERGDAWMQRHNLHVDGLYVMHANKQVAGLTRPRRRLRARGERLIGLVPKPAAAPTPASPFPQRFGTFEKRNVAA